MTEEELEHKADVYHLDNVTSEEVFYHSGTSEKVRKAFIDGARSRESEIEELKSQIEKMKCCGNCSKRNKCTMDAIDSLNCDKWEF